MKFTDVPHQPSNWQALHRDHVSQLRGKYDAIFKRFSALDGIILLSGHAPLKNSRDDQNWPVVPTPHFVHWTPFQSSPAVLVIKPATKPHLYVEKHTSYWEGPGPESDQWDRDSFDVTYVDHLQHVDLPTSHVVVGDDHALKSQSAWTGQHEEDVLRALDATRTSKSAYEIASIRSANMVALRGHEHVATIFASGEAVSELGLHHEYLRITGQTDFSVPYGNIFGLGEHGAILHHVHYDPIKRAGDLSLLVDAGATCNGYASDITRSYVRGRGHNVQKFGELIAGVEHLQQKLCKKFLVGTDYQDLHNEAHELIASLITQTKLSSASVDELVSSGATRCLFPHGLGHSLGIQVHDVGMKLRKSSSDNPYLRNTSQIAEGQVVTVEPGLYFIPALLSNLRAMPVGSSFNWTMLDELKVFGGIRIEDNMLATASGPVNLTRG